MAGSAEPGYWSPSMPLLAEQRREMPDIAALQQTYVRYGSSDAATASSQGWQKPLSQRANLADASGPDVLARVPDSIVMEIIRAPAEFAVPVKQDRRLKPPFKVRVSMKITSSMHCPIVLCAHAISQTEFERIETWRPPEMAAKLTHQMVERPTPTELKGNLSLEWRFEGLVGVGEPADCLPSFGSLGNMPLDMSLGGERGESTDSLFANLFSSGMPTGSNEILLSSRHIGISDLDLASSGKRLDASDYQACLETLINSEQGAPFATRRDLAGRRIGSSGKDESLSKSEPPAPQVVSHDFEFPDLEFAKPSRMNKVYVVFACQIAGVDLMYTTFSVPTICFCRREQKERAYQRLGIPFCSATTTKRQADRSSGGAYPAPSLRSGLHEQDDSGLNMNAATFAISVPVGDSSGMPADYMYPYGNAHDSGISGGHTAAGVKEYVIESYYSIGMVRKLSHQDVTALLALAGFPQMGEPDVGEPVVTTEQFQDFKGGWECILKLLQKIHHCWNSDDPHVVCGFEVDHYCAVNALRGEPPGTFLCRFSLSQPGNMVLVCKVPSQSPNADADGLVHGLLNVGDLQERRVDKWINDFPGATHLLDVYTSRRVDKRKAFHTSYSALRDIERLHHTTPYGYSPDQPDLDESSC